MIIIPPHPFFHGLVVHVYTPGGGGVGGEGGSCLIDGRMEGGRRGLDLAPRACC